MTNTHEPRYTASDVLSAVMKARENWDEDVYEDDNARTAARIGAANVLRYLD